MHELTAANAADYLARRGWLGPGSFAVEELSGGVSNVVLRVRAADGRLAVLKQSRPQLRTAEAWFSDVGRVFREQEVMRLLAPRLPAGAVPEVLAGDPENYAFLMTHAPLAARDWRTVLLAGEIDVPLGQVSGELLGQMHRVPVADLDLLRDATVFRQLRVEPFYDKVMQRHPDLAGPVGALVARMAGPPTGLCHGDYSPKNLLLADGRFTLVDHETAHAGDPAMDLGFFLSHLLLKAVKLPERRDEVFALTRGFWEGYAAGLGGPPPAERVAAGIAHTGLCLVARVDGTSPAPYLVGDELRRDAARRLGRRLLGGVAAWNEVLAIAGEEAEHSPPAHG
jgi:5-methylthioribose kinase